ncbi:MAG: hypothetical protein Q9177_005407 [Variospora cf. flavescens]
MTAALGGVDLNSIITQMQSSSGAGDVLEDSRRILLRAAKEVQYSLETPKETCDRFRYSGLDLSIAHVFYQIKLFDILVDRADSPISTRDLANETKTDPNLLENYAYLLTVRLLRYAACNGSVKQSSEDSWTASRLTRTLAVPSSQANLKDAFINAMQHYVDLPRFLAQTNYQNPTDSTKTVAQLSRNTSLDFFDWMKENPKHYEILNSFMAANRLAKIGIDAFPFEDRFPSLFKNDQKLESSTPLFVDIGGGRGQMSRAFKNACPSLPGRIIFQDLPQTLASVPSSSEGSSTIEPMAHDFFQPQPIKGARIYFLRHVLHDWPNAKAELILKNTVDAMRGHDSALLIDEKVLPDMGASLATAGLDLNMMMTFAAQERTEKQWRELLTRVGLRIEYLLKYNENTGDSVIMALLVD